MPDDLNEQFDLDILRKLGLLPPQIEGVNMQPSPFPVINTGPQFGPQMEAELGAPYALMPPGEDRSPLQSAIGESPAASVPGAGSPPAGPTGRFMPWTTNEGIANLPIMQQPGGQLGIGAPEGNASWTPANPQETVNWIQQKLAEQTANREAAGRRAEVQAKLEIYKQREAERQQQMANDIKMNQSMALQELARTNPQAFLAHAEKLQRTQALANQHEQTSAGMGSAEAQAFRNIVKTQGMEAALAWLNTQQAAGHGKGPLTPEQHFANTMAETMARYGPEAQRLRAETAGATSTATGMAQGGVALNKPVLTKRGNWINQDTGEFASETDTPADLTKRGFQFVSDKALQATATARAALSQLKRYRELANQLLPDYEEGSPFQNILNVGANRAKLALARAGGEPGARALEGMHGTIATIARATGDTANIAVAERGMLQESVTNTGDTKQSAIGKIDQLEKILNDVVNGWGSTVSYMRETGQQPSTGRPSVGGQRSSFSSLPPAKDFPGKTARDEATGRRFRSDGNNWMEIR